MAKARILLAEDERVSARLTEMMLKSLGYSVPVVISSGEEAIRKAGEVHPDLVLMDILLEGKMDGVKAAEEINNRFNIPVIYLTAYAEDDLLKRAKIAEPYGYILKPFKKTELHSTIDMALHKHRMDNRLKDRERALEEFTAELKAKNKQLQREITERKRVEEKLKESETRYRTLIENAAEGVCSTDKDETITFVNGAFADMLGYKPEELVGQNLRKFVSEEGWLNILCSEREKRQRGEVSRYELTLLDKNGTARSVLVSAAPLIGQDGRFLSSLAIITDITERKKVEEALKESEGKFHNLVESVPVGIIISTPDGRIIEANKAIVQMHRYGSREEFMEIPATARYYDPADRERFMNLIEKGPVNDFETRRKRLDGTSFWASLSSIPQTTETGERVIITVVQDITERKQAEEALVESEEKFRNLAEISPNMIFINRSSRVIYANRKCEEVMGYTREEFCAPDFDFLTLIAPEFRETVKLSFSRHMEGREVTPYEYQLITKDKKRIDAIISTKLIEFDNDVAILGIITDITERKQAEEALVESEEKFRLLTENSTMGIFIIQDFKMIYVNPSFAEVFGYRVEEITNMDPSEFIHPIDRDFVMQRLADRLSGKMTERDISFKGIKKDGSIITIQATAVLSEYRGKPSVMGTFADITERERAIDALIESEARYRALVDLGGQVGEAVVMLQNERSKEGVHIFCSDAWLQITGYSRPELRNMTMNELIHPKDRTDALARHRRRMSGESIPELYEMTIIRKDGTEVPVELTSAYSTYRGKRVSVVYVRDLTKRKKVLEALRQSEEKLRLMFETLPDGITVLDKNGKILEVNKASAHIHGYDNKEEMVGLNILEILDNQDHLRVRDVMKKTIKEGYLGAPMDFTDIKKDGSKFPVEVNGAVLRDAYGNPTGLITITKDITQRKEVEEAILETSGRLQLIQQVIEGIHSSLDLAKVFEQITDEAVHSLGYTTAIVIIRNNNKKCYEVKALSTKKRFLPQINKTLGLPLRKLSIPLDYEFKGGLRSVLEGNIVTAKRLADIVYPLISPKACSALEKIAGTKNYIVVPLKIKEELAGAIFLTSSREEVTQGEISMVQTFSDVVAQAIGNAELHTQTEQVKETLRQSEENLRAYLESAPDGVYISNLKGTFLYGNKKAEQLIGYQRAELIGQSFIKLGLLPAKYVTKAAKLLALNAVGKPTGPDEFELTRRGGDHVWVEINTAPINQGEKKAILGFVREITERKQAQQALEVFSQQLQEKVSELEALSYGIAHDLRSPLLSIEGFSRLLRDDIRKQRMESVEEDIRLLESGVRKMQHFLNRTLEYSRAGSLVKLTKHISFGKIVEDVVKEFVEQLYSVGATVSIAKRFPRVCVDETRIRQLLSNLIQNSIKYRSKSRPLKIEIGCQPSGDEVIFFVRDNGAGIDNNEVEKIFDLFYRGTTDSEGSGAGLAIVKKIIEAHGGKIWVQARKKEGTTMCFTLPQQRGITKGDKNGED